MARYGINFRATSSSATDDSGDTYSLGEAYPTTRGGLTFGFSSNLTANSRNRSTVIGPRLAGIVFGNGPTFTVDLPDGPGVYRIQIAAGDAGFDQLTQNLVIKDGANTRATVSGATTVANFRNINGTQYTAADWNSNFGTVYADLEFYGSTLVIEYAGGVQSTLAHLSLEFISALGDPPQGTVTISAVDPGSITAEATYSYSDTDEDSFEARLDGGTPFAIGASPATITGLSPATTYDLEIRAVNAFGVGDWSDPFEFTTDTLHGFDFDTDPDAPIFGNLSGSPVGIALLASTNLRMYVHDAETGALVASDVVTTDASGMLARWEDIAIADNTPYRIDFETADVDPMDRSTWSVIMTST